MKHAFLLAPALGLAFAAAHAHAQMSTTTPAEVRYSDYTVEPSHTRILFSVSHMGFSTWYGDFTGATGTLTFDGKNPAKSQLSVSIPTASISTTNTKLDGELKSAAWFDAATYPTITFTSTRIAVTGHNKGTITGDLTLHGVTHPITLTARFNGGGSNPLDHKYTIGFDATGELSRSSFGMKTYVPLIGDAVTINLSGAFEAK